AEGWAAKLGAEILATGSLRLKAGGDVTDLAGFNDGGWWVQDAAAALPARLLGDVRGKTVIDLCAAPGGKTALMLQLGQWQRAVAADLRLSRARLMRPAVSWAENCSIMAADATNPPFAPGAWNLVLLDAPCTGTGTFRRHPELKWRLAPEAIRELAGLQHEMLVASLGLVAPGGALLYTTCSVEPEENEGVVAELPDGFEVESLEPHLPTGVPWIPTSAGGIRILPNPDGDGFTMHALRRDPSTR
ncbi:MAG: RsmB/NOP family class I SAM-dependent RNA methyltransferase, partial [Thermoanaerobaculales bacterium]|nr:RsmB/NOP family class I SAM-dependent RNA methyltransferase [Thermoanaerobaculales bacterium]